MVQKMFEISGRLGAKELGSHFGIFLVSEYENPEKREKLLEEGVKGWRRLSRVGKEVGFEFLIFEPMSISRVPFLSYSRVQPKGNNHSSKGFSDV